MIKQPSLTLPLMLRPPKREWRDQGTCFHISAQPTLYRPKNAKTPIGIAWASQKGRCWIQHLATSTKPHAHCHHSQAPNDLSAPPQAHCRNSPAGYPSMWQLVPWLPARSRRHLDALCFHRTLCLEAFWAKIRALYEDWQEACWEPQCQLPHSVTRFQSKPRPALRAPEEELWLDWSGRSLVHGSWAHGPHFSILPSALSMVHTETFNRSVNGNISATCH